MLQPISLDTITPQDLQARPSLSFPWSLEQKVMYIIAGCNGTGKTTAFYGYLSQMMGNPKFVNPDEIAKRLCPSDPRSVDTQAALQFIYEVDELLEGNESFCVESTLAGKSYRERILKAQSKGFKVVLFYFWVDNVETAILRVKQRVIEGGHYISPDDIRRRHARGKENVENIYKPIVDAWEIFDNSNGLAEPIGFGAASCYNTTAHHWIHLDREMLLNTIFPILKKKALNHEQAVFSFSGRNITMSAENASEIYNKLYQGIDEQEWNQLEELAKKNLDASYQLNGMTLHIPASTMISILATMGHHHK